MAVR
jgi:hypothetical protein